MPTAKKKKRKSIAKKGSGKKGSGTDKLDVAAEDLRKNHGLFDHFLDRMDKWFRQRSHAVLTVMKKFDHHQEGLVTYDEFKSAMFDIDAPCNVIELHLLCKILDIYCEKNINYTILHDGLSYVRESEESPEEPSDRRRSRKSLSLFSDDPDVKQLVKWDGKKYTSDRPRYALVNFRLVTFEKERTHSTHVSEVVDVNTNGLTLAEIILNKTHTTITTTQLKLYIGRQCTPDQHFAADSTLWQHGCTGGTRSQPEPAVLYYNYATMFNDCPLLMCDYYINMVASRNRDELAMRNPPPFSMMAPLRTSSISSRKSTTGSRRSEAHD